MSFLDPQQIYSIARNVGFPADVATKMVAIALRESGGNPNANYKGATGTTENSFGLWQINLQDSGIRNLLAKNGINESNITDPVNNAKAAYLLWGGNDKNLDTAWYINRPGYSEKYQANLPIAQQAMAIVEGLISGPNSNQIANMPVVSSNDSGNVDSFNPGTEDLNILGGGTGQGIAITIGVFALGGLLYWMFKG